MVNKKFDIIQYDNGSNEIVEIVPKESETSGFERVVPEWMHIVEEPCALYTEDFLEVSMGIHGGGFSLEDAILQHLFLFGKDAYAPKIFHDVMKVMRWFLPYESLIHYRSYDDVKVSIKPGEGSYEVTLKWSKHDNK